MFWIKKIIWFAASPLTIGLAFAALALVFAILRRRRCAVAFSSVAVAWLWFFSTGAVADMLGRGLMGDFPPPDEQSLPTADAIVVLGGGISLPAYGSSHAELHAAADRAWAGARLWKAGKAPVVVISGVGSDEQDAELVRDLGVTNIVCEGESRNTHENAMKCAEVLGARRVLLVTSAWHMKRAIPEYEACGMEVVPVPCDYECAWGRGTPFYVLPDSQNLSLSCYFAKEYLGRLARK